MSTRPDEWVQFVKLWLHGRPQATVDQYKRTTNDFRKCVGKQISQLELKDIQRYADTLVHLKPRTLRRKLTTVRSLISFCCKTGLIAFDVGRALRMPRIPDDTAAKILPEVDIRNMIDGEPKKRDSVLLQVLYAAGIRASEAAGLDWKDCKPRGRGAGQITVLGKGGKTRSILLPSSVWKSLVGLRAKDATRDTPVFLTDSNRRMSRNHITIIVSRAAKRAGIDGKASAHTLRHSHASHSMSRGATLAVIQQTLGHANITTTSRYLHAQPNESSSKFLGL